jgi:hypothetical protein
MKVVKQKCTHLKYVWMMLILKCESLSRHCGKICSLSQNYLQQWECGVGGKDILVKAGAYFTELGKMRQWVIWQQEALHKLEACSRSLPLPHSYWYIIHPELCNTDILRRRTLDLVILSVIRNKPLISPVITLTWYATLPCGFHSIIPPVISKTEANRFQDGY